jgi:antitoxin component YwqK of YwqJK toxin-antitoxin module
MRKNLIKNVLLIIAIISFLFISTALLSCRKKEITHGDLTKIKGLLYKNGIKTPFTGREKAKLQGRIIEYNVVDGVKNGDFKISYSEGKPEIVGQMVNDKNEGHWKYYYESLQVESEGNFRNDLADGNWIWYYPDGKMKEEGNFIAGKRDGKWITYEENGKVSSEIKYKNGELIIK